MIRYAHSTKVSLRHVRSNPQSHSQPSQHRPHGDKKPFRKKYRANLTIDEDTDDSSDIDEEFAFSAVREKRVVAPATSVASGAIAPVNPCGEKSLC